MPDKKPHNVIVTPKTLASEVTMDTGVPYQTALVVIDRVFDILIEQIVNNERTTVNTLFSVVRLTKKSAFKGDTSDRVYLSFRSSRRMKQLFSIAKSRPDQPFLVNRNTWRAAVEWYTTSRSGENGRIDLRPEGEGQYFFTPKTKDQVDPTTDTLTDEEDDFFNPMLEDD